MSSPEAHARVAGYVESLHGPDPFDAVRQASVRHREEHSAALGEGGEQRCGVYPSDHLKMRVLTTVVKAAGATRILEIGGGLGYSGLWLADGAGRDATVETIDRWSEHCELIDRYAGDLGYKAQLRAICGDAEAVLAGLSGPYDLIHDDGWFGERPPYLQRVLDLLRPGGLLVMSNWFLLGHSITGDPETDWSQFAGPNWAENVQAYARHLVSDERLYVSFILQPSFVALACKR